MEALLCLNDLKPGECAVVTELNHEGRMRRRLCDVGLIEGTPVECIGISPLGDPAAYRIRGAVIAIRAEDARKVLLRRIDNAGNGGVQWD